MLRRRVVSTVGVLALSNALLVGMGSVPVAADSSLVGRGVVGVASVGSNVATSGAAASGVPAVRGDEGVADASEPAFGPVEVLVEVAGADVLPRVVRGFRRLGSAVVTERFSRTWMGFSGLMDAADVPELRSRPGVVSVAVNPGTVTAAGVDSVAVKPLFWGVDRLDQRSSPNDGVFLRPTHGGAGVDVHVVDNGVMGSHQEFAGINGVSRVVLGNKHVAGKVTVAGKCADHGTPIASIIGGSNGVAPGVRLVSHQVGCGMDWSVTKVLSALEDVARWQEKSGRPTVVNLSLGAPVAVPPKVDVLADAVDALVRRGVVVVAAAGNDSAVSSCDRSPSHVESVITVGAVGEVDDYWIAQSTPECTDVFAPGLGVAAAMVDQVGAGDMYDMFTGTSFAVPHVAGVVALLLADNPSATPAEIKDYVVSSATRGVITPSSPVAALDDTANRLLHYGIQEGAQFAVDVVSRTQNRAVLWIEGFDRQLTYEALLPVDEGYVSGQFEEYIEITLTGDVQSPIDVEVVASQLGVTQQSTRAVIPGGTRSVVAISDTIPVNGGFDFFISSSDPSVEWSYVTAPGVTVTPGRFGRISVRGLEQGTSDVVFVEVMENGKLIEAAPVVGSSAPFNIPSGYFTSPPTDTTRVLVDVHGIPGVTKVGEVADAVTSVGGQIEEKFSIVHLGVTAWVPWSRILDLAHYPDVAAVIPVDTGTTCGAVEGQNCPPSPSHDDSDLAAEGNIRAQDSMLEPVGQGDSPVTTVRSSRTKQSPTMLSLDILDRNRQGKREPDNSFTFPTSAGKDTYIYVWDDWARQGSEDVRDAVTVEGLDDRIVFTKETQAEIDSYGTWCPEVDHGFLVSMAAAGLYRGVAKKSTIIGVHHRVCGTTPLIGAHAYDLLLRDWNSRTRNSPEAVGVVNMSWGIGEPLWNWILPKATADSLTHLLTGQTQKAGDAFRDRGLLSITSAGNEGQKTCGTWPETDPHGITVGAARTDGYMENYSNYGSCVDIFAPGDIRIGFGTHNGTSFAAPYVAGWAASLMTEYPGFPLQAYKDAILSNAEKYVIDFDSPGVRRPFLTTEIKDQTGAVATQVSTPATTGNAPPQCALGAGCSWIQLGDTTPPSTGAPQVVRYDLTWDDGHRTQTSTHWATTHTGVTVPVWGSGQTDCSTGTCSRSLEVNVMRTVVGTHPLMQTITVDMDSGDHLRQLSPQRFTLGDPVAAEDGWLFPMLGNFVESSINIAVSRGHAAIVTRPAATPGGPTKHLNITGVKPGQDFAVAITGVTGQVGVPVFFAAYFDANTKQFSSDIPITTSWGTTGDLDSISWDLPTPAAGVRYVTFGASTKNRPRITVTYDTAGTPTHRVQLSGMRPSQAGIAMVAEIRDGTVTAMHVFTGGTRPARINQGSLEIQRATRLEGGFQASITGVAQPWQSWQATTSHGTVTVTGLGDGGMPILEVTGLRPRQSALVHVTAQLVTGEILSDWVVGRARR